jgi:hypothetical protein
MRDVTLVIFFIFLFSFIVTSSETTPPNITGTDLTTGPCTTLVRRYQSGLG